MSAHTPGPWRSVDDGRFIQASRAHAVNPGQPHDLDVARVCGDGGCELFAGQRQANAALIAAAPDLLAALREIASLPVSKRADPAGPAARAVALASAAIAKAVQS